MVYMKLFSFQFPILAIEDLPNSVVPLILQSPKQEQVGIKVGNLNRSIKRPSHNASSNDSQGNVLTELMAFNTISEWGNQR